MTANPAAQQGWIEQKDPNTGRTYYANTQTRQTQWERPTAWVDSSQSDTRKTVASHGNAPHEDQEEPLPEGVEKMFDPTTQKAFYVDHIRKVTTWTRPTRSTSHPSPTAAAPAPYTAREGRSYSSQPSSSSNYHHRSYYEEAAFYAQQPSSDVDFSDALPPLDFTVKKVADALRTHCPNCDAAFTVSKRRHHCRLCGDVFCDACSSHRVNLPLDGPEFEKAVRVCDFCKDDVDRGNFFSLRRYLTPLHLYFANKETKEGEEVATADNVNAALSALTIDVDQMVNHPEGTDEKMTIPPDVLIREVCKHLKHPETSERSCVAIASLLALENLHGRIHYASQVILYGAYNDVLGILERSGSDRRTLFVQEQAARIVFYVTEKRTLSRVAQETDVETLDLSRSVKSMLDHASSSTRNPNLVRWSAASLKNLILEDQRRATMAINDLAATVASGQEPSPLQYESFLADLLNTGGFILMCGLIGSSDADVRAHAVGALEMALNSMRAVDASKAALFEMTGGLTGSTDRKDGEVVQAIVAGGGCGDPVSQLLLSAEDSVAGMGCLFLSSIVAPLLGEVRGCGSLPKNYDYKNDNSSFGACREAVIEISTGSCLPALVSIARERSRRSMKLRVLAMQTIAAISLSVGEMGKSWANGQFEEGLERAGAPSKLKASIIFLNEEGAIDLCLEILRSSAGQSLGSSAETDHSRMRECASMVLGSLSLCSTEAIMNVQSKNILANLIVSSNDSSAIVPSAIRGDGAPRLIGIIETVGSVLMFEWQHPSGSRSELLDRLLEVVDAGVIPYLSRIINMKIDWESTEQSIGAMRARVASCRLLCCIFGIALTDESNIGFRRVMEAVDSDSRSYRGGDKAPSNIVEAALTVLQSSTAMGRKVMLGTASQDSCYTGSLMEVVETSLLAVGSMCGSETAPGGTEGSMISGETSLEGRIDQFSKRRSEVCRVACDIIVRRGRAGPALLPSMLVGGFGEGSCLASMRLALAIAKNGGKEEHAKLALSGILVPVSDSLKSALANGDLYKFSASLAIVRLCGPYVAAGQAGGVDSVREAIKVATNVLTLPINPNASLGELELQESLKAECISSLEALSRNTSLWSSISNDAIPSLVSYLQNAAIYGIGGPKSRTTMAGALRSILQIVQVPSHAVSVASSGLMSPLSLLLKISENPESDDVPMLALEVIHAVTKHEDARKKASLLETGFISSICTAVGNSSSLAVKPEKDPRADVTFLGLEILYRTIADMEKGLSVPEIIHSNSIAAFLDCVAAERKFLSALCATLLLKTGMRVGGQPETTTSFEVPTSYGPPLILVEEKCAGLSDTHEAAIALLYSIAVYASVVESNSSGLFWETVTLSALDQETEGSVQASATLNVYFLSLLAKEFAAFDDPHRANAEGFDHLLKPLLRYKLMESLKESVSSLLLDHDGHEDPYMISLLMHYNVPHICLSSWSDPALLDLSFELLKSIMEYRPDEVLHLFVDEKPALLSLFDFLNKDVAEESATGSHEVRRFLADLLAQLGESNLLSSAVKRFDMRNQAIASLAAGCLGEEERPTGEDEDMTSSKLSSILMQCLVNLCDVGDSESSRKIEFSSVEAEILAETLGQKLCHMVISRFLERAKLKQYEIDEDEDIMDAPDVAILCAISQQPVALEILRSLGGLHALSLVAGEGKVPAMEAIQVASKDNIEVLLDGDTYLSLMKLCSSDDFEYGVQISAFSLLSDLCQISVKGRKAVTSADECSSCAQRAVFLLSDIVMQESLVSSENDEVSSDMELREKLAGCACIFLSSIGTSPIAKQTVLESTEALQKMSCIFEARVSVELKFAVLKLVASMTMFVDISDTESIESSAKVLLLALNPSDKPMIKPTEKLNEYLYTSTGVKGANGILRYLSSDLRQEFMKCISSIYQSCVKSLLVSKSGQNPNEKRFLEDCLYSCTESFLMCNSDEGVFSHAVVSSFLSVIQWFYDPKTVIEKEVTKRWRSVADLTLSALSACLMRPDSQLNADGVDLSNLANNTVMLTRAGKAPRKAIDVHSVLDAIIAGKMEGNAIAAERLVNRLF